MQFKGARGISLIHLLKIGVDTRKYSRIVSNLLDMLEDVESCRFNMHWFCKGISKNWEIHLFYLSLWYNEWFNDVIINYLQKISTYAKYSDMCTYDNIDSFMNIVIDLHNFRIYDNGIYQHIFSRDIRSDLRS